MAPTDRSGRGWHLLRAGSGGDPRGERLRGMDRNGLRGLPGIHAHRSGAGGDAAADGADTVVTRIFDIALDYPWPPSTPERVIRNAPSSMAGTAARLSWPATGLPRPNSSVPSPPPITDGPVNAGQGVVEVTGIEPVAVVIARLCDQARDIARAPS